MPTTLSTGSPGKRTTPGRPRSPRKSARSSAGRTRSLTPTQGVSDQAMTATVENETATGTGRVARVIGPVVDVEFPAEAMPEIYFALNVDITYGGNTRTLTLEVEQHIEIGRARV